MSYEVEAPTPPATGTWYDLSQTTADVLAILRLTEQDVDVPRIEAIVPTSAIDLEQYLDSPDVLDGPPPWPPVQQALILRSVERYNAKGDISALGEPVRQALDSVRYAKKRWGVA